MTRKKLDAYIADQYARLSIGKAINIMDIGKVVLSARAAYAQTNELRAVDIAIAGCILLYCNNPS